MKRMFCAALCMSLLATFCFSQRAHCAPREVKFTSQDQKVEIENLFIILKSNFNKSFKFSTMSNYDLVAFGVRNSNSGDRSPNPDGETFMLPDSAVEYAVRKYFNLAVGNQTVSSLNLEYLNNGFYKVPGYIWDNEEPNTVKLGKVYKDGDIFTVYADSYDIVSRKTIRKQMAKFQRLNEAGLQRFIIREYRILK